MARDPLISWLCEHSPWPGTWGRRLDVDTERPVGPGDAYFWNAGRGVLNRLRISRWDGFVEILAGGLYADVSRPVFRRLPRRAWPSKPRPDDALCDLWRGGLEFRLAALEEEAPAYLAWLLDLSAGYLPDPPGDLLLERYKEREVRWTEGAYVRSGRDRERRLCPKEEFCAEWIDARVLNFGPGAPSPWASPLVVLAGKAR